MSETYLGSETVAAEGYLQPKSYRIFCLCHRCDNEYSWVAKSPGGKDRPCPRRACKAEAMEEDIMERAERLATMLAEQRAPAVVGANNQVRAIDTTAEIVMQDYNMTDLKTNVREGEGVAPKLPAAQQRLADGFFGGKAIRETQGKRVGDQMQRIAARAIKGAYGASPINPGAIAGGKPGVKILRRVSGPIAPTQAPVRQLGRG